MGDKGLGEYIRILLGRGFSVRKQVKRAHSLAGMEGWDVEPGVGAGYQRHVKEQEEGLRVKGRSPFTKMGKAHQENT